jgi:RND family efflux transporter MFP subunit
VRLLLPLVLVLLTGCEAASEAVIEDQSVRPARVFRVTAEGATTTHEYVGRVEAAQTVDVSFEVAGPLARLPVREGQTVRAGELIAALDPTDFQLALREADVQLKLARQDLERKDKLFRDRGISESVVDDARALYDLRAVRVLQAREALADTRIVAPFDAYVARRFTDNHVNVRVGDKIARLNDLNELFVVASIPQSLAATSTAENVVSRRARFAFIPDERFDLEYRENTGEADAVAQTYEVTYAMPRPEAWNILPGMSATVELELNVKEGTSLNISIPTSALVADAEKAFFVWVYDPATHYVERRAVEVGPAEATGVPIRTGLSGGELIVATGATNLQSGMRVRILGEPTTDF